MHFCSFCSSHLTTGEGLRWKAVVKGDPNADFPSEGRVGVGPCFLLRDVSSGFVMRFELSGDES